MHTVDTLLKAIFSAVYKTRRIEIDVINSHFHPNSSSNSKSAFEDLKWLDATPVIPFPDAVQLLIDDGWTDDEGNPPKKDEDLSTRAEIRLGEIIKVSVKSPK